MEYEEIALSDREFERVKQRVYAQAGISLSDAKRTLVVSRLGKIVRQLGLSSIAAYLDFLEHSGGVDDAQRFVNALTTNLTRFYREDHHFAHLVDHVGRLMSTRRGARPRLRIWSAGCSTGQEPYSITMSLLARFPNLKKWDFLVLATDIDTSVVERARTGIYPISELSGLNGERAALFEKLADGRIRVPAAARERVVFKPLNLMDAWPMTGPFDAIFCRNVAIYFDKPTQARLFGRLGEMLAPDGYLYVGHSENLGGKVSNFKLVGQTIYRRDTPSGSRTAA